LSAVRQEADRSGDGFVRVRTREFAALIPLPRAEAGAENNRHPVRASWKESEGHVEAPLERPETMKEWPADERGLRARISADQKLEGEAGWRLWFAPPGNPFLF